MSLACSHPPAAPAPSRGSSGSYRIHPVVLFPSAGCGQGGSHMGTTSPTYPRGVRSLVDLPQRRDRRHRPDTTEFCGVSSTFGTMNQIVLRRTRRDEKTASSRYHNAEGFFAAHRGNLPPLTIARAALQCRAVIRLRVDFAICSTSDSTEHRAGATSACA